MHEMEVARFPSSWVKKLAFGLPLGKTCDPSVCSPKLYPHRQ